MKIMIHNNIINDDNIDESLEYAFSKINKFSKTLNNDDIDTLRQHTNNCNLFPFDYFYIQCINHKNELMTFNINHIICSLLTFRKFMPKLYNDNIILHQLRVNYIKSIKPQVSGIYSIFLNRSVSFLVEMFKYALEEMHSKNNPNSIHTFINYNNNQLGFDVVYPYGNNVLVRYFKRDYIDTYNICFPIGYNLKTSYNNVKLPINVMDIHDILMVINEYNCDECGNKLKCNDINHLQTVPIVECSNNNIYIYIINVNESKNTKSLYGTKRKINMV